MSILQKYILREWAWTLLAVTVVLIVVMLGVTLGDLLGDIARGRMPPGLLLTLLLLNLPEALTTIVPLAVFVSVIWGLGRLYRDQEMSVMRASGFHWQMLLGPLLRLLVPVAAILLTIGLLLAPLAAESARKEIEQAFRNASEWGLQAGQFHVLMDGDMVLYVESVDEEGRRLNNVFIHQRGDGREQVWIAEQGYYWLDEDLGQRFLTLEDGQVSDGTPGQLDYGMIRFARNDIRLPELERSQRSRDVRTRPSGELLFESDSAGRAELQWRLSPALAIFVLGLLAIPLAHASPREGRSGRVVMGIMAYATYANLLYMCRAWIADGSLPAILGMWWVHALVLMTALVWLRRQGRRVGRG